MQKKYFIITSVSVFLVGLIGGAYLVLNSAVTSGELTNSTPISEGKSSDELLNELLKLNELEQSGASDEYIPPEEKNLTDDFIATVVAPNGASELDLKKIKSDDFEIRTIVPYLQSNEIDLFPIIPDSVLKIIPNSPQNYQAYFKNTSSDVTELLNLINETLSIKQDDFENSDAILDFRGKAQAIGDIFNNLSKAKVPKKLVEAHKKIIVSAYSAQKIAESFASEDDPLKSLIITNQIEEVAVFWDGAFKEYESLSKKNQ